MTVIRKPAICPACLLWFYPDEASGHILGHVAHTHCAKAPEAKSQLAGFVRATQYHPTVRACLESAERNGMDREHALEWIIGILTQHEAALFKLVGKMELLRLDMLVLPGQATTEPGHEPLQMPRAAEG
jgi:hypothetical protein